MATSPAPVPTTLKWSKKVYTSTDDDPRLAIVPGSSTNDFKAIIQSITGVPTERQKLLCKHGWKGTLKSDATFDTNLSLPPKLSTLTITLIGSAEKLPEPPPPNQRTKFVEDITAEEIESQQNAQQTLDESKAEGMIVALQRPPGEARDSDSNKTPTEMYQYNRMVYALPQYQIENILRTRRRTAGEGNISSKLAGNVVMTMGLELRRAYVNDLATLADGTLVSVLDDGHVQLWRHAELVEDVIHGNAENGGVEHVVTLPQPPMGGPAFATAGQGVAKLWTEDGEGVAALPSPQGTSPRALVSAAVGRDSDTLLLAAAYKITRQSDPNQFRLVPQDEAGRRRRAQAEEQERLIQQGLAAAASCVSVWIRRPGGQGMQVEQMTIEPPPGSSSNDVPPSPVTSLATLSHDEGTILVCGNAVGDLRLVQLRSDHNLQMSEYKRMHLRPTNENTASVVCMEPISGSLLALSTRQGPAEAPYVASTSDSTAIDVPFAQAVYIIDTERCTLNAVLNGHTDAVLAMCMLPDGGLATCGGKTDAKTKVWDKTQLGGTSSESIGKEEVRVLTESASTLDDVGYVFALTVLPDTKLGSKHFALAAARYNVVKICI